MKKVYIHAYLAKNVGDDLMVYILCKRYPHVQFYLFAPSEYKRLYKDLRNLKIYAPDDPLLALRNKFRKGGLQNEIMQKADACIVIGGSMFIQQGEGDEQILNVYRCLRLLSKKIYLIGANFGPYKDEKYYEDYHDLLRCYDGLTFREAYSYKLFQDLPQAKHTPDVVFSYKPDGAEPEKKQVAFSLISFTEREPLKEYEEAYRSFILKMIRTYLEKGYGIKLVSFCKAQGDEEAIQAVKELLTEEENKKVSTYFYGESLEECVRQLQQSEIIVGTRFHSMILGWILGKKVLPIIYDQKIRHVLEDVHYPYYLELDQLQQTDPAVAADQVCHLEEEKLRELTDPAQTPFWAADAELN